MKVRNKIQLPDSADFVKVFGPYDKHLKLIRNKLNVKIVIQSSNRNGREICVSGSKTSVAQALAAINAMLVSSDSVTEDSVMRLLSADSVRESRTAQNNSEFRIFHSDAASDVFSVKPRTDGQDGYLKALQAKDIVIAIGPAGTGKTYLAVARALMALKKNEVRKIVLCRPAVEAGERLGFLPGDYQAKVNPYLRPLYDALNSFIEYQQLRRLMETEIIEVVPLAYMRGRNLDNAFMILDEAQNSTSEQMKMFLTRMGQRSKIVVTGDVTQIDLPPGKISGLVETQSVLGHIKGITICYLTRADIVRHPLV